MADEPISGTPRPLMSLGETILAEKAERYRSLFAYSPHGVFSLDLDGRVTDANDALQQLSGHSLDDLLMTDFYAMVHPDDVGRAREAFAAVIARRPQLLEARLITASGEVREVKMTSVPVVVSDQVVGVHGITEDVTEANIMYRELEAANAVRTLFLANVSHEVRTPLAMVLAATEMLLDSDL
ncbi:PAS domain S-box protein, partial [Nocardioides sp.]|uniref:PAS domain S-box protein n=1 Tax=Nocardioides sp. TaxID=35761 RepID=UPI0027208936